MNFFFKFFLMSLVVFFHGCSLIQTKLDKTSESEMKLLSCEKKAKPKSLQLLEQKYRCTSQK